MADRSIQVWIVCEEGYEYTRPIKVWDNRRRADYHARRLEETRDRRALPPDFLRYSVIPCPMIQEVQI